MDTQSFKVEPLCKIRINGYRGSFSKTRFLTRLFHRYVFCGITPQDADYSFLAFNDSIYKVDYRKKTVDFSMKFECEDMHRPLAFFEIRGVKGFFDSIVFGEYSYNKSRHAMSVFQYVNDEWKKVYSFPSGSIKHIHSIIPDPFRNRILILTGDLDHESMVWEAKNNFSDVKCLFGGKQEYRFCCAKAYEFGTVLITDSPYNQNNIFVLYDRPTVHLEKLYSLPGPTVFFASHNNDIVFATDVEDDAINRSPISRFLSNRRGAGVLDEFAHVFLLNSNKELKELASFKKDVLPMRIFGFGTVHFPDGNKGDNLFLYPMSVKKLDQVLLCIKVENTNENC